MRNHHLFHACICYICPDSLSSSEYMALECCLRDGNATILSSIHSYEEKDSNLKQDVLTHIICHPEHYNRFLSIRNTQYIAILRPEWVFKSFLLQYMLPVSKFTSNPQMIFSGIAIATGSIDQDSRKVIDRLITHLGGQIVETLSDGSCPGATHVLNAGDISLNLPELEHLVHFETENGSLKYDIIANELNEWQNYCNSIADISMDESTLDTKGFTISRQVLSFLGSRALLLKRYVVNLKWIEESLRQKTKLNEAAFNASFLPSMEVVHTKDSNTEFRKSTTTVTNVEDLCLSAYVDAYQSNIMTPTMDSSLLRIPTPEQISLLESTLEGAIVLLSQHIAPYIKDRLSQLLKQAKAKVANVPLGPSYEEIVRKVVSNATFVVCQYKCGCEYAEALQQKKTIVGILWVIQHNKNSNKVIDESSSKDTVPLQYDYLIQRPIPSIGGIPGMQNLAITLTGYTSRTTPSREELAIAIQLTGACMLPVLSRSYSTHLICLTPSGQKFKTAQSWHFSYILSHKWIFECLQQWTHCSEKSYVISSDSADEYIVCSTPVEATAVKTTDVQKDPTISEDAAETIDDVNVNSGRFEVDEMLFELKTPAYSSHKDGKTLPTSAFSQDSKKAKSLPVSKDDTVNKSTIKSVSSPIATPIVLENKQVEFTEPSSASQDAAATLVQMEQDRETLLQSSTNGEVEQVQSPMNITLSTTKKAPKKDKLQTKKRKLVEESVDKSSTSKKKKLKDLDPLFSDDSDTPTQKTIEEMSIDEKPKLNSTSKAVKSTKRERSVNEEESPILPLPQPSTKKKKKHKSEKPSDEKPTIKKVEHIFLLTGSREECAINESLIQSLGGKVCRSGRNFDPTSTHIISKELKRTEKFVAGCAAGKWILKQSYLEASSIQRSFVNEEEHEWGRDEKDIADMDARIWPGAPKYWRMHRANGGPGAFQGWQFFVHNKVTPPVDMCERIIRAADGVVIPLTKATNLKNEKEMAEKRQLPLLALISADIPTRDTWLKKLKKSDITCINATFLIDYLTKDPANTPQWKNYII